MNSEEAKDIICDIMAEVVSIMYVHNFQDYLMVTDK